MKPIRIWGVLLCLSLLASGCRGPSEVERDNRRLLDAILTAITIKNTRLLEQNARWARTRHDAGHLTDQEYQGLEAVINKARGGDWPGAEKDGYEFRKQHPFVTEGH